MKFSTVAAVATTLFASSALAKNVACVVENQQVAVVDLDTGSCPFTIPARLPVAFKYVSSEEYDVEWYYTLVNNEKFRTDIRNEGRVITVPARFLYGTRGAPLFQVHLEKEPASNSTAAIRRRLMKEVPIAKRDEVDDFITSIEDTDGTSVDGSDFALQVVDIVESSSVPDVSEPTLTSTASGIDIESSVASEASESTAEGSEATTATEASVTAAPQSTVTEKNTVIMTVTSCHNDVCVGTTVSATLGPVTTTVSDTTTVYTTYCPVSSFETIESTKIITVTSCSNNACHETTVEATPITTETVVGGTVTEYVTYCPLTSTEGGEAATKGKTTTEGGEVATKGKTTTEGATQGTVTEKNSVIVTVTSCHNDICKATTVPGTKSVVSTTAPGGETTVYTTYCPVSSVETVESTKIITAVVCKEDKCHETTVEATPSTTSGTIAGETTEVTEYVTYCPVTTQPGETVATEVVTSEGSVYVPKTVEVTSEGTTYETTIFHTVSQVTKATTEGTAATPVVVASGATTEGTTATPVVVASGATTVTTEGGKTVAEASVSGSAAISTYEGSAASSGASLLALALIPLAYFF